VDQETIDRAVNAVIAALPAALAAAISDAGSAPAPAAEAGPDDVHAAADAKSVADALAEKARWDAMSAEELAAAEARAARTRLADAIVDILERGGDPGALADLEAAVPAGDRAACRAAARSRLSGNAAALARLDAGLKSRREEMADLVAAITSGKATREQQASFVEVIAGLK